MMLSIVIPAHNEEDNIEDVVSRVENSMNIPYELIVVNDHSIDNTRKILERLSKKYRNLRLFDNDLDKGFANAIKTGFSKAGGDAVIPVMSDLCDDLPTIKLMLDKLNEGFDVVCGSRYIKGGLRLGGSRLKGLLSASAGRSLSFLLGLPTHDVANSFKMYRKKVIESITIEAKAFDVSMELLLKAYYLGFKVTEVPTVWKERQKGKSTFKVFKLLPSYLKLYFWAIKMRLGC